jgi:AraC-like DNA-binding protein
MAPHHFHRTFRALFGRTPFGYVSERRVARARRLLAENDWPVADICVAVGYESLPSFTRRFKQATGVTPAAFRDRVTQPGSRKLRIRKRG